MIQASAQFKNMIREGANVVNYATITFRDGTVLELEPKDFMINGCTIEDATTDGSFGVGFAIGKTAHIALANYEDQFTGYDFYKATFVLYCALKIGNEVEKIRKGTYYINEPETPGEIIQFSAVDAMHLFDREYTTSIQFPTTLQLLLTDACQGCGVEIGFGQFDNFDFIVNEKPTDCTFRDVVSWVAQIACKNARINNFGALELVWWDTIPTEEVNVDGQTFEDYESHDYIINGGDFTNYNEDTVYDGGNFYDEYEQVAVKDLNVGTDIISITGVKVVTEDTEVLEGTDDYCITLTGNELVIGKEAEVAEDLYQRLADMRFRIATARILCNPLFEPIDLLFVKDRKGNKYVTIVNSVSYNNGGYTILQCAADSPMRNESYYSSEAAKAVVKARRETREAISNYDIAVQNMNRIAANAMGFFTTNEDQPDGSRIVYLHDKPTLADSMTIYKMSSDGFFVSTDGGETYTAGIDAQGNAVVNILSAVGIQFDWARGGTLVLGGQNNINGEIQILNADGVPCGKINNNGISMYSPTSLVQVIITPEIGLVMRDAEGNEFYGLTTRQKYSLDFSYTHRIVRTYTAFPGNATFHAIVIDKTTTSSLTYRYKCRYYWTINPEWMHDDTEVVGAGTKTLTLPISFKDKNISVQINDNGITQELISASTKNKMRNHYNTNIVKTKADGSTWTDASWSSEMYLDYAVGSDMGYYLSTNPATLTAFQYANTAFNYAGSNYAILPMPAQNDYLTDITVPSTAEYTLSHEETVNNTVPSVSVSAQVKIPYEGETQTIEYTYVPNVGYVYYLVTSSKNLNIPVPDLVDFTLVATC